MLSTNAQALFDQWKSGNVMAANCPSRPILQHLTSRWGTLVMIALATGPHRFAELRRKVDGVSERMLSQTLKDLEADGFVLRTAHAVVPPHVDYELTSLGREAAKHVVALAAWIELALPEILSRKAGSGRADSLLPHNLSQNAMPHETKAGG
jgi:DNA-binding HxlR family transcriptional regulator